MPSMNRQVDQVGLMVSFGNNIDGLGFGDMIEVEGESNMPSNPPVSEEKDNQEKLLTQNTEKTVSLTEKTDKSRPVKSEKIQIQTTNKPINVTTSNTGNSVQKQQEIAKKSDNLIGSAFGNGGKGSGNTKGDERQGNPAGSGNSGGHDWSLTGRSLIGSLVTPDYPSNVEGKITVVIRVGPNGNVTSAAIGSPTNISDAQTRNAALSAARSTHFSEGKGVSIGSITYNFKLK